MKTIFTTVLFFMLTNLWAQDFNNPLSAILKAEDTLISNVMANPKTHELQIIYTQIDRDSMGNVQFHEYQFQENSSNYFYPASTVKLPVALLAMEKYLGKNIGEQGAFELDTAYKIEGDSVTSSFQKDLNAIFAVSDNEAYNRLFEFLGRDTINAKLAQKGLQPVQIVHRVSTPNSSNPTTKQITVYPKQGDSIIWNGYTSSAIIPLQLDDQEKGKGFMDGDTLVEQQMDFSEKNYFPLKTQQEVLKRLFFPQFYDSTQVFALSEKNRDFIIDAMQKLPRENCYDPLEYKDSAMKYFIYGDKKEEIPPNLKIHNKVGEAYGTLTDNAYIKDAYKGVEFFLSATLLVNKNGIFNDDDYDYETVGIPFLAELGRRIYQYELSRKREKFKKMR